MERAFVGLKPDGGESKLPIYYLIDKILFDLCGGDISKVEQIGNTVSIKQAREWNILKDYDTHMEQYLDKKAEEKAKEKAKRGR